MKRLYGIIAGSMAAMLLGLYFCTKDVEITPPPHPCKIFHLPHEQPEITIWHGERYWCWDSGYEGFCALYPADTLWSVDEELTGDGCLVVAAPLLRLKMIAKRYVNDMPLMEKYEAMKVGTTTSSVGEDYFLLAGKMYDDMRFFEKDIKGEGAWYYTRVEFPASLAASIDPLLQFVKDYQLNKPYCLWVL